MLSQQISLGHELGKEEGQYFKRQDLQKSIDKYSKTIDVLKEELLTQRELSVYADQYFKEFENKINEIQKCQDQICLENVKLDGFIILEKLENEVSFIEKTLNEKSFRFSLYKLFISLLILSLALLFYLTYLFPNQRRLKKNLEFKKKLLEQLPLGLMIVDENRIIKRINPKISEIFGYDANELIGHKVEVLVPEDIKAVHHKFFEEYYNSPTVRDFNKGLKLSGHKKDGTHIDLDISLSLVDKDVLCLIRDTTEENILKRENSISSQMSSIGVMAAGIAHELKNPLTILNIVIPV